LRVCCAIVNEAARHQKAGAAAGGWGRVIIWNYCFVTVCCETCSGGEACQGGRVRLPRLEVTLQVHSSWDKARDRSGEYAHHAEILSFRPSRTPVEARCTKWSFLEEGRARNTALPLVASGARRVARVRSWGKIETNAPCRSGRRCSAARAAACGCPCFGKSGLNRMRLCWRCRGGAAAPP